MMGEKKQPKTTHKRLTKQKSEQENCASQLPEVINIIITMRKIKNRKNTQ